MKNRKERTPRAVTQFAVDMVDPQLGWRILGDRTET